MPISAVMMKRVEEDSGRDGGVGQIEAKMEPTL